MTASYRKESLLLFFPKNVNGKPTVKWGRKTIGSSREDSQVPRERSYEKNNVNFYNFDAASF